VQIKTPRHGEGYEPSYPSAEPFSAHRTAKPRFFPKLLAPWRKFCRLTRAWPVRRQIVGAQEITPLCSRTSIPAKSRLRHHFWGR